jgi:hypothetical protein
MTLLIVGSVILGLAVLEAAKIGQCITADDAAHDQIRATDCGNPDAVYLVASQSEGTTCPDGRQAGHSSYAG